MRINPKFKSLIPPLSQEEYSQLEANILSDGCRDPLVAWNGFLVDGHNRYQICSNHNIEFEAVEYEFESEEEVIDWIIDNQLGRRNLDPTQASILRGKQYNRLKKGHGGDRKSSGQNVHLKTADDLAAKHGVDEKTIRRDGQFAEAVEALEIEQDVFTREIDAPKRDIIEAAKPVVEAVKSGADSAEVKRLADEAVEQLRKPHVTNNSGENEWYTPSKFIDAAKRVLGEIDLDPASSDVAQKTVQAKCYYTAADDGLSRVWSGRVWLNPPYERGMVEQFTEKLSESLSTEGGAVTEAILLVNNATDTGWFQDIAPSADAICFVRGRISFNDATGEPKNKPLQGQMFLYFGSDPNGFMDEFGEFGVCLVQSTFVCGANGL